jgi:hypothetical protein
MGETKICPECHEDFGAWPGDDSDGVIWREDGENYCSAECVVIRIRRRDGHPTPKSGS